MAGGALVQLTLLADAGLQVAMASTFGSYLDKRELQPVLGEDPFAELSGRGELWLDYVAATGGGFDAGYTVAFLVGHSRLDVEGLTRSLHRAEVLVFGGDQVYQGATAGGQEDRLVGPFTRMSGPHRFVPPHVRGGRPSPRRPAAPGKKLYLDRGRVEQIYGADTMQGLERIPSSYMPSSPTTSRWKGCLHDRTSASYGLPTSQLFGQTS